jgi:protein TonB
MLRLLFLALLFNAATSAAGQSKWERGKIQDNKRVGVWEYYDDHAGQELGVRFDYDSSRVSYIKPDTARYYVLADSAWQVKRLTRAPRLIVTKAAIADIMKGKLRYPAADLRARREGTVVLSYVVNEQGIAGLPTVTTAPSQTLAQEVLRAADQLPLYYIPGVYRASGHQPKFSWWYGSTFSMLRARTKSKRKCARGYRPRHGRIPCPPAVSPS